MWFVYGFTSLSSYLFIYTSVLWLQTQRDDFYNNNNKKKRMLWSQKSSTVVTKAPSVNYVTMYNKKFFSNYKKRILSRNGASLICYVPDMD